MDFKLTDDQLRTLNFIEEEIEVSLNNYREAISKITTELQTAERSYYKAKEMVDSYKEKVDQCSGYLRALKEASSALETRKRESRKAITDRFESEFHQEQERLYEETRKSEV